MKTASKSTTELPDFNGLSADEMRAMVVDLQAKMAAKEAALNKQLEARDATIKNRDDQIKNRDRQIKNRDKQINILEEMLRLRRIQKFGASSEKYAGQRGLFDEAEIQSEIDALADQLPDDVVAESEPSTQNKSAAKKRRQRGFSADLCRKRIELLLSEADKANAERTFFTKVKEELHYIPAQLEVHEYWQEKAVFPQDNGSDKVMAAKRPPHPLGKCQVSTNLIAQVITAKYVDGLPLHRQQQQFNRLGHDISRGNMASWLIQLAPLLEPLIDRLRHLQNTADYLQADETRIQVLKEDGKRAQSDKWMWVTRGGPPDKPSVLFAYDPSRAGQVAVHLLDGFKGILQADGYAGYGQVCRANGLTRIGCWDHARRKFVEAVKAEPKRKKKGQVGKASVANRALSHIRKLYQIERQAEGLDDTARYRLRQEKAIPCLNAFKSWLEKQAPRTMKGGKTRKAIDYTLSQWESLIGYCERGNLAISNVLAENAIRPFAIGRKNWLFADTTRGAHASAIYYSLIETAKANGLEPAAYITHLLNHIAEADTPSKLDVLLPWQVSSSA